MTSTVSIYNVLIEATTARLIDQLITNVDDDSKPELVSDGLVRGLSTENRIRIMVKTGDSQWKHTLNIPSQNVGVQFPLAEIGGKQYWRERFVVEIELFFTATISKSEARTIAGVILSRARWSLQNKLSDGTWWFSSEPDYFGETASSVQVMDAYMVEGGSENKWTWRGEIRLEFVTENDGCV